MGETSQNDFAVRIKRQILDIDWRVYVCCGEFKELGVGHALQICSFRDSGSEDFCSAIRFSPRLTERLTADNNRLSTQRSQRDVTYQFLQINIFLQQNGFVTVLKQFARNSFFGEKKQVYEIVTFSGLR